ncbi:MAG: GAF domain-containing protein [Thermocrispum agreste]|uniref:GAF domain-containing protein n=2 Tax=Thermocrispum agreste TaxID=37925 RepID=A0ABD6FFJ7_9PSEU
MTARTFLDLLYEQAPREEFERLVVDAEQRGDPAAARLREMLPRALHVRDTLERQRKREAQLSALYETANDLTAIRDLNQILRAIVRRARQLLGTDIAYLGLNVESEGAAYIRVTEGSVSDAFANLRLPLGTGLLGLVAQTGQPYATPDYHADDRFEHRPYIDEAVADESIRAILGVPMTVSGRVIGALLAANRTPRPFPAEEVQLLSSFAAHAAIALENARLFEQVMQTNKRLREHSAAVEMAADVHDKLTGVLLRGGDSNDVAGVLSEALDAKVEVCEPDDPQIPAESVHEARATGHAVQLTGGQWIAAATAGGDHLATLLVNGRPGLDLAEQRTLERGAMVTALLRMVLRAVAEAEDRVRADLLDDLLAEPPADPALLRVRALRHGVRVDEPMVLAVVDVGDADRTRAQREAARLAAQSGGLSGTRQGSMVLALPGDDALRVGGTIQQRLGPVTVGVAGPVTTVTAWAGAYREARQCERALLALGRAGQVADQAHLGFARLLLGHSGPAELDDFMRQTIGPLLDYDQARGTELAATLDCWFEESGSATAVSRRLHIHPNTVAQRLDRITTLLGHGWREPARVLDLRLALRLWRLRESFDDGVGPH